MIFVFENYANVSCLSLDMTLLAKKTLLHKKTYSRITKLLKYHHVISNEPNYHLSIYLNF